MGLRGVFLDRVGSRVVVSVRMGLRDVVSMRVLEPIFFASDFLLGYIALMFLNVVQRLTAAIVIIACFH